MFISRFIARITSLVLLFTALTLLTVFAVSQALAEPPIAYSPENVRPLVSNQTEECPLYKVVGKHDSSTTIANCDEYDKVNKVCLKAGAGRVLPDLYVKGDYELQCVWDEIDEALQYCYDASFRPPVGDHRYSRTYSGTTPSVTDECAIGCYIMKIEHRACWQLNNNINTYPNQLPNVSGFKQSEWIGHYDRPNVATMPEYIRNKLEERRWSSGIGETEQADLATLYWNSVRNGTDFLPQLQSWVRARCTFLLGTQSTCLQFAGQPYQYYSTCFLPTQTAEQCDELVANAQGFFELWNRDQPVTFYLRKNQDGSCTSVANPSSQELNNVCDAGELLWAITPISLLWHDTDVDKDVSLVAFPLEPGSAKSWFIWKASDKAPLLVYDPDHTGKINSAFQLFGNWTFGGKRLASLGDSSPSIAQTQWANGYEALASLDANGDKKLSGEELKSLALWFDSNKDGISQEGEVKDLISQQVISIYFTPNRTDQKSGNIYADLGFERLDDGKLVRGASVDWHSVGLESKYQMLSQLFKASPDKVKLAWPEEPLENSDQSIIAALNSKSDLSGIWQWKTADDRALGENVLGGLLTFRDTGDGKFVGHSISQLAFAESYKTADYRVDIYSLAGRKLQEKNGQTRIEFNVKSRINGRPDSTSIAVLSPDGQTLSGTTKAMVYYHGKSSSISYAWVAKRKHS